MFQSLLHFINKFWKKKEKKIDNYETVSKFQNYLDAVDKKDPMYEPITAACSLCDEALKIVANRLILVKKVQNINEKIMELECFGKLNEEEAENLKNLLDFFVSLTKDRNVLRYQLTSFDPSLDRMLNLEDDANFALKHIQDAEKAQRLLRHDLGHLQGEKEDLIYEREQLETGLDFINKFSMAVTVVFALVTLFLGYISMFNNTSVFFPVFVLVILLIIVVGLVYSFRKRMIYELNINIKKQKKAIEFINKKNAVLAHYTNFLRYEYKKYQVRNSQMLESNLKEFGHYKYVTARVDSIRKIMYETENKLESFIREKNIGISRFDMERFAKTANVEDKLETHKSFMKDKLALEEQLLELDARNEKICDLLEELKVADQSEEKIIDEIIQVYFEEVGRLIDVMEKRDISDEEAEKNEEQPQ